MKKSLCWLNGALLPLEQAAFPPADRGLLYGDGLFETVRVYAGLPFRLQEHLERLENGARFLELPLLFSVNETALAAHTLITANAVRAGVLRLLLTGGSGQGGIWPRPGSPSLCIMAAEGVPYREEQYRRGFRAAMISFPRNEASPLSRLKTLSFLENVIGRREALARGCDEGLFVNRQGLLAEGTTSNLFLVTGNSLVTPPLACGLLPGVTRKAILELATERGLEVRLEAFSPADLLEASEAFLTASLLEIMPLVEVEGKPIGTGSPGTVTNELRASYRAKAAGKQLEG